MKARLLSGVRVLVGRTRHQAGALSAQLRVLGAEVIEIPFIEIRKPKSFEPLDAALKNLDAYDWLILTSVNGVDAMWERIEKMSGGQNFRRTSARKEPASTAKKRLRVAAIGPATKRAIEQRGMKVDVVPKEYVAESVVRSLKNKVKGKHVLLVRAKVARDVIPRELRKAGAQVDVVEAYETVVPRRSRARLLAVLKNPKQRPQIVIFTSSSTVRNFAGLLRMRPGVRTVPTIAQRDVQRRVRSHSELDGIRTASIGPVTSATLRELGLPVDIAATEFTIPGLVAAIAKFVAHHKQKS